jgi:dephospho-CoA kinase
MKIIGLTGSIAMGKSEVAKIFMSENIPVFDADKTVHALYDSAEGAALLAALAPEATRENRVDRIELSKLIMKNPDLLKQVETLVHAVVARERAAFLGQARVQGNDLVVLDVPLLFEKNLQRDVDVSVVVSAPEHLRRQRALARADMTEVKLDMIISRQMSDLEKRKRADYVIDNDGTLEDLRGRTKAVLQKIRDRDDA